MKDKTSFLLGAAVVLALLIPAGCSSLIPKQVELFQKKVKEFPEQKPREVETQREAAALAADRAQDTLVAAVSNASPPAVIVPATDTADLTRSVSTSLGPPADPWKGEVKALSTKLDSSVNALSRRIDSFKERNDDLAGKKIEDTGLIKVPYLAWLGGAIVLVMVLVIAGRVGLTALKAYGTVNPAAGIASSALSMAGSIVHRGFEQVVAGGENFKAELTNQLLPALENKLVSLVRTAGPAVSAGAEEMEAKAKAAAADVIKHIQTLFANEQMKAQDKDVQGTVSGLTK